MDDLQTDAERILRPLLAEGAQVVLIGGLAAVLHGVPYVTNDIDLAYAATDDNRERIVRALAPLHPYLRVGGMTDAEARALPWRFGVRTLRDSPNMTLSTDAGALDLLATVAGVGDFAAVRAAAVSIDAFGLEIPTLDLPALIESKRVAGRPKDRLALPQIEATWRLRELERDHAPAEGGHDRVDSHDR